MIKSCENCAHHLPGGRCDAPLERCGDPIFTKGLPGWEPIAPLFREGEEAE